MPQLSKSSPVPTGGIPIPDPDFIDYAVTTFHAWETSTAATGDRDPALVRHVLNLLATWGWADEVLQEIDRERAGT